MAIRFFKEVVDSKGYRIDSKDREIFEREDLQSFFGLSDSDAIEFVLYDANDNQLPQSNYGMARYIPLTTQNIGDYFLIAEGTLFQAFYFPNEYIYKNELYPLKRINFENTTIMVPNIQINTLFRTYSSRCLTACKIINHTDVHEVCSKNFAEVRYRIIKNIYELECALHLPRNIMFTSLQYKLSKKIEKKMNSGKKNILFNKIILKTAESINDLL